MVNIISNNNLSGNAYLHFDGNYIHSEYNLDYIKMESIDTTEYQFTLDNYSDNTQGYYYINNHGDWYARWAPKKTAKLVSCKYYTL